MPGSLQKLSSYLKNIFILLGTVALCAVMAELALRYVPGLETSRKRIPVREGLLASLYERFVKAAPGIERSWFYNVPRPLVNSLHDVKAPPGISASTQLTKKQVFQLGSNYPTVFNYELIRQELI